MNQHNGNGPAATAIVEPHTTEQPQSNGVAAPMTASGNRPYIPKTEKKQSALKENAGALLAGAGIVIALILFAFGRIPHQPSAAHRGSPLTGKQQAIQPADNAGSGASSILPITDTGHPQEQGVEKSGVGPDEIARTAKQRPQQAVPANLGGVVPFSNQQPWDAASFQGTQPTSLEQTAETQENKNERDAMDKPSLVFVKNAQSPVVATRTQDVNAVPDVGIGLLPGTRLRARLESMVSTAVQTPVVAVVEYNYERGGEIIVPAGTRVFGHLEAADRTGYVGVRFDSMMMPDGTSISVEAAATDLRLRPLRGKVEGQQRGKNILVRSAAGVGEVMATLAGRGSLNQPLSEGDLLRERVSNNIAQASDEEVNKLAVTAHLVVSVPADTEIYIVLQKATKAAPALKADGASATSPASSRQSVEQLRQLLQLQKELSQESSLASSSQ